MQTNRTFPLRLNRKYGVSVFLILLFAACWSTAAFAATERPMVLEQDTTQPKRLPCYKQLEKDLFHSAFIVISHTTSIQSGIIEYIVTAAEHKRAFQRCLRDRYPNGIK